MPSPPPRPTRPDPLGAAAFHVAAAAALTCAVLALAPALVLAVPLALPGHIALRRARSPWLRLFLVALCAYGAWRWWQWLPSTGPAYAAYVAAYRGAGATLLGRLRGAPLDPAHLTAWGRGVLPGARLAAGPLAVLLCFASPRSRTAHPQEGDGGRDTPERAQGNGRGASSGNAAAAVPDAPLRAAPDVLHALDHDRRVARVRLAGDHFTVGSVGMMHGPSGEGKSRWLAEVARAITRGEPVFGWPTVQTAVVWVTEESMVVWKDKAALMAREGEAARWWTRWLRGRHPRRYPPTVWPLSLPDSGIEPDARTFPDLVRLVERMARRTGARLVIFDTLMAVCPQAVKDNEVAKVFIRQCAGLARRANVAVELVHHDNNEGNPLGAKMLKGACDYTHHVYTPEDADDPRVREVAFGKRYEPYPPPPLRYRMADDGRLYAVADAPRVTAHAPTIAETMALVEESRALPHGAAQKGSVIAPTADALVLDVVTRMCAADGYATAPQVMLVTGMPKTSVWKVLRKLQDRGVVAQTKAEGRTAPARWTLTTAGESSG